MRTLMTVKAVLGASVSGSPSSKYLHVASKESYEFFFNHNQSLMHMPMYIINYHQMDLYYIYNYNYKQIQPYLFTELIKCII